MRARLFERCARARERLDDGRRAEVRSFHGEFREV
jgi:hypothetical protein